MTGAAATLKSLKDTYLALHERKEDLFWATKMGTAPDLDAARTKLADAEKAVNGFLQDPNRLDDLRALYGTNQDPHQRHLLRGWIDMLNAHVISDPAARALSAEIVEIEADLERQRANMPLGYVDPDTGRQTPASSVRLGLMMRTDPDERRRKAAFEGLRSIEHYVLGRGFLDVVKRRNQLGRMLGYEDYYDWRVSVTEQMSKRVLFGKLDDLERRTRAHSDESVRRFTEQHGRTSHLPYNFTYWRAGKLATELDPYFGFGSALRRWGESFVALGVTFRGATLTLDLLDRPGKYENGFMHGPGVAFADEGVFRPARINFTANAVVGQVGSGLRAAETLFHEGGHAAHFSNVIADAPCFSHEFAPTSVAYAETQSMFMDALLSDADWRHRYARDDSGRAMPFELIEMAIREQQPLRAWDVRALLTVPFAERALYEIPNDELVPDRVLETFRTVERRLQGLEGGVRPVLAVPHLLAGEASAYYHGYVLAEMAVHQTRQHFLSRDGYLADNPRIGPDLASGYWNAGNAIPFDTLVERLTGRTLNADALVAECLLDADRACDRARRQLAEAEHRHHPPKPLELDATVRVTHGDRLIATSEGPGGFAAAADAFADFIAAEEAAAPG